MAYTLTIPITVDEPGLTWSAQLVNDDDDNVGSAITTGFTASDDNYVWEYDGIPDDFVRGKIVFTANSGLEVESQIYPAADSASGGSIDRPVTWEQAKKHLNLDTDEDQDYVEDLIDAATDYAETALSTTLIARDITQKFYTPDALLVLPNGPLVSITSVTDTNSQAITAYDISRVGNSDRLTIRGSVNFTAPVTVVYRAGYSSSAAIPASIRRGILAHVGTMYANRESATDRTKTVVPHSLDAFYRLKRRAVEVG